MKMARMLNTVRPVSRRKTPTAIAVIVGLCCWAAGAAAQPMADKPRHQDFREAKRKARAWFDRLEVDPVELLKHRVKGKKKVAEILGVYKNFLQYTTDPAEVERILGRVRDLAAQTRRPEYHNMDKCDDKEFVQNSMSYLRVLWLLEEFGLDTGLYWEKLFDVKPRLDDHFRSRGPWQRAMFADYYDRFDLEKPPALLNTPMKQGVIGRRLPAEEYDPPVTGPDGRVRKRSQDSYDLTHEVFVAFNYGLSRTQDRFAAEDLAYTRQALPVLVRRYIKERNPDLAAELLSCMTYLGWHSEPAYREGIDFLLDVQNPDGTWGDYERYRPGYGKYLDQHLYLHTTMVACRALVEAYDGNWKSAGPPATPDAGQKSGKE